MFVNLEGF
jgi:nucleoside-triphosphate--adenylate kinase